ncbi:MAG: TerB family tellurite resistance protein [Proteobacteria bacterium]|nr:TerB family tellurite resistance protein [Pseudomonadota bacterium]
MGYDASAVKSRYGRLPKTDDQTLNYAKAVKLIVGADGKIPAAEAQALRKGLGRLGATQDLIDEVDKFDHTSAKLEDLLGSMTKGGVRARMLLRDAIEISRADGHYADEERAAAARAAQLLGVDASTLKSIEALVEMEHAVASLRKALFPKKA